MMSITDTIILAVLQGVTEWLPISSSGHLILAEHWFQMQGSLAFDVFLHMASLLVILIFFRKKILAILKQAFDKSAPLKNWWWYIIISSIPTALIGFYLYGKADQIRTPESVANWFLFTSVLLLATKFSKGDKDLNWKHAILIGLMQGLAVMPGLSRSGSVIALALIMRVKKEQAFDYGFIVAIPAIFGSFLLTFSDLDWNNLYLLGFSLTVLISYLSLIFLKLLINKNYFYWFFIYTLVLSLIIKIF
jgi:undecaprenyl-diphosphatase